MCMCMDVEAEDVFDVHVLYTHVNQSNGSDKKGRGQSYQTTIRDVFWAVLITGLSEA